MTAIEAHSSSNDAARKQQAAEASIIGSFMRDRGLITDLADISPAHFTTRSMQEAWRRLIDDATINDDIALQIAVPDLDPVAADLIARSNHSRSTVLRARSHVFENRSRSDLRRLYLDGLKALDAADQPASIIADGTARGIAGLSAAASRSVDAADVALRLRSQENSAPISTGIRALDYVTYGGCHCGSVLGVFARYKVGKTVLAATLGRNLEGQHVPTLMVSLERRHTDAERFIIARALNVDARDLDLQGNVHHQAAFEEYQADGRYLRYVHRPGITIDELRAIIMAEVQAHGIKVVLIDYWQLITNPKSSASQQEKQQESAQMIADLAATLDIAIVVFGQLNQEGQPRGGEGILAAAGIVVRFNRPEDGEDGFLETMVSNRGPGLSAGNPVSPSISLTLPGPHIADYEPGA